MTVHVMPDEVENVRPKGNSEKSSDFTYHNKDADTDMSSYNRVLNALKKLDTLYNPMLKKMNDPFIKRNYKVIGDTRFISIMKHKDGEIQWACSTSIYTDAREPETIKEAMMRPNGNL